MFQALAHDPNRQGPTQMYPGFTFER
jgi:predicted small metal-binding protein